MKPIESGQRLLLSSESSAIDVRCIHVVQRNWSRVAVSEELVTAPGAKAPGSREIVGDGRRDSGTWFLKQSLDRRQQPQEKLWRYERDGIEEALRSVAGVVRVPRIGFSVKENLLHAFEFLSCVPPDELLRRSAPEFAARAEDLIQASARILAALEARAQSESTLDIRERSYGSSRRSTCFKGLDIRNLAWRCDVNGALASPSEFVMFDFGKPYLTTVEEAGAKLFVSIGLLNWGRPLRRFVKGPDLDLLTRAHGALGSYLSREAVLAEIDLQERGRLGDPKSRSLVGRTIKRLGIGSIGMRYLSALRRWCHEAW